MDIESAAMERASENRIGACAHGRASRAGRDAALVGGGIIMFF